MTELHRSDLKATLFLLIVLLIVLFNVACTPRAEGPPNIVVILADDLGWMDTGVYGSDFYETPNIDGLAHSGLRFLNAYSSSPLCSPTRASILTGLHPARIGMTTATGHFEEAITEASLMEEAAANEPALTPVSITRLPDELVTYAEVLESAGYRTAFMGKWHLGHPPFTPESQGFDVVVGGRAHPGPPPPGHFFSPWNIDTIDSVPKGTHIADALTDEAIEFMQANKSSPFLLNLWYYDVHAPYQAPADMIEKYKKKVDGKGQDSPTMAAMVEKFDSSVGRVLNKLKELELDRHTVVIFASDNGGNMYDQIDGTTPTNNAPLRSGKGNNYEGGVRVPLIVAGTLRSDIEDNNAAKTIQTNITTEHPVSTVDLFATILDIAGASVVESDGVSFLPTLHGQEQTSRPIFSHFPHYVSATANRPNTSVIKNNWKLYQFHFDGPNQTHRYELYDLSRDISETRNVAAKHPKRVAEMTSLLAAHLSDTGAVPLAANPKFTAAP